VDLHHIDGVEPTNNHAERGLRGAVIYRKLSLGSQSDQGERTIERAQRELGKRLQAVERDRCRKPERVTFAALAARYEADYLPGRNLKPSTVSDYGSIIRGHLVPHFGHLALAALEPADVDAYVAAQAAAGPLPQDDPQPPCPPGE
jgi:hypothetical protein